VLATQMVTRFGMGAGGVAHAGRSVGDDLPHDARTAVDQLLEDSMLAARALVESSTRLLETVAAELVDEETLDGKRLEELRQMYGPNDVSIERRRQAVPVARDRERRRGQTISVDE
jgi:ATP-dependent Zn protease